jgi:TRAP-type C4-dicarboxylate transport system substrate-binding protein
MGNVGRNRTVMSLIMVFVFLFSVGVYCSNVMAAETKVRELKWAVFVPENDFASPPLKRFAEDVERYTNGAVKIRIYWPGQLAEVKEMPELVRRGSLDMSTSAPTFYPAQFPLNVTLQSFPMMFTSTEQAAYVWRGLFRDFPEVQKEFTDQNQRCLNRGPLALYYTLTKKPVRTPADFKGMKIRGLPGKYFADIMGKAGAANVVNPISEVYEGLMRGTIDGVMLNLQVFDALKYYETAKYVSLNAGTPVGFWISINSDLWNSFDAKTKDAFNKAAIEWGERFMEVILSSKDTATNNLKSKGVQFIDFDQKAWDALIASVGDPWVMAKDYLTNDLKVDPKLADRFVKRWRELIDEYDKNYTKTKKVWKYQ